MHLTEKPKNPLTHLLQVSVTLKYIVLLLCYKVNINEVVNKDFNLKVETINPLSTVMGKYCKYLMGFKYCI